MHTSLSSMTTGRCLEIRRLSATLLLALGLCFTCRARADHIETIDGDELKEPAPGVPGVHILREDLVIDMRPLVSRDAQVQVRARYTARNDGPASGEGGQKVPAVEASADQPASKNHAAEEPRRPSQGPASLSPSKLGEQELTVSYQAVADMLPFRRVRSFGVDYGLAPARAWASFGTLNVELLVPEDWQVLDLPSAMHAAGPGIYRGHFSALPASPVAHAKSASEDHDDLRDLSGDALRFHVSPPPGPYDILLKLQLATCWVAAFLPFLPAIWLWRRARSGTPVSLPGRLVSFLLSALLVYALPLLSFYPERLWFPLGGRHFPMSSVLFAWFFGGLFCVLGHAAFGWRRRVPRPLAA